MLKNYSLYEDEVDLESIQCNRQLEQLAIDQLVSSLLTVYDCLEEMP